MLHLPKLNNVYFLAAISTVGGMLYVSPVPQLSHSPPSLDLSLVSQKPCT